MQYNIAFKSQYQYLATCLISLGSQFRSDQGETSFSMPSVSDMVLNLLSDFSRTSIIISFPIFGNSFPNFSVAAMGNDNRRLIAEFIFLTPGQYDMLL